MQGSKRHKKSYSRNAVCKLNILNTAKELQPFNFAGQSDESVTNLPWADYHLSYDVSSSQYIHDFLYLALLSYLHILMTSAYLEKASRW